MFDRGLDRRPAGRAADRGAGAAHARGHDAATPDEVVAVVPPDLVEVTVEKVAINAVMAGCRPEYLPWVLAAVEAVCTDEFNIHGVLATTMPVGPVIIVQRSRHARHRHEQRRQRARPGQPRQLDHRPGAAARRPQRRRRAPGRGRPGDARQPRQAVSFCFAEDEHDSPLDVAGREPGLAAGRRRRHGVRRRGPALHRRPDCRARPRACATSLAACLRTRAPPEAGARLRRHPRASGPSTPGCSPTPAGTASGCSPSSTRGLQLPGQRARPGRRRDRRGRARARSPTPRCPSSAPAASCSCTPAAAPGCSRPSSAAGPTAPSAAQPVTQRGGVDDMRPGTCSTRPGERTVAERELLARPASIAGLRVGLLDISKPRGDVFLDRLEERARRGRGDRAALPQADVHQAGAGRPAPRDRHPVRGGDRGPRRLRQLHVVQCARHQRSGARGVPGVFVASAEFVEAAEAQATSLGFPRWPGCSRPTRSRTAPTTRCAPTPTPPSTSHRRRHVR